MADAFSLRSVPLTGDAMCNKRWRHSAAAIQLDELSRLDELLLVLSCIVTGQHSYGVKRSGLGVNAI